MDVEGREALPGDGDRIPVAEMHDSIDAISDADMGRLVEAARGFSHLCGIPANDLLNDAFKRALEGSRTCERGEPPVSFLCGVMRCE